MGNAETGREEKHGLFQAYGQLTSSMLSWTPWMPKASSLSLPPLASKITFGYQPNLVHSVI